jgi:hypothetical protein
LQPGFQPRQRTQIRIPRYEIHSKRESTRDFHKHFCRQIANNFHIDNYGGNTSELDERLAEKLTNQEDIGTFIDRFDNTVRITCTETFKHYTSTKINTKGRSVPWWSTDLTVIRKRMNALRRRYQRTQNNEELRSSRKNQYIEEKKKYQAAIRKEKTISWKEYCTITTPNNPGMKFTESQQGKQDRR